MASEPAIGTRIKRARERLRWTQKQLADALSVDRKTVDNWENDRAYPRSSIGALEDVLCVRLDGQDDRRPEAEPISDALRAQIHRELGPEAARRVIGVLEGTLTIAPAAEQEERRAERRDPA